MNNQSLAGSDRHISQGIGPNDTSGTLASSSSLANGLNQSSTAQHIGQAGQSTAYSAFSTDNTDGVGPQNDGQGQIAGLQSNSEALQVTPRIAAATNAPTPGYPPTLTPYTSTPIAGSASASTSSTSTPNATYLTYLHHFQQQQQASPSTPGLNPNVVGSSTPPSPAVYRSPSQPHTPPSSSSAGVKRKHEGDSSGSTSHLPKTVRKRRVKVNLGLIPATTSTSSSTLQPTFPSVQQATTTTSSFDIPARSEPEREEQGTYAAQQDLGGDGHPAEEGVEEPPSPSPQQTPQQQQQHEYRRDRPGAGGAKHWTDDEKTQLFVWMLSSDEHWQMFGSQMNTVFRNAATSLFEGRKSFTALKSCYHRNVETYKQIYAFEAFLTQTADPNIPKPPHFPPPDGDYATTATNILYAPVPTTFTSSIHRETFLEQKLEAARTIGKVPVGNINVKVIDHWYRTGWHALFRRRYKADPPFGGTPVPYHGPLEGNPVISLYPPPPDMDPDVVQNLLKIFAHPGNPHIHSPLVSRRDSVEDEHDHDEIGYAGADNEDLIHSTSSTSTSQKPPRVTSSSSTIVTGSPRRQTIKPPPQSSPALTQANNNHLVYPPTASSQPQPSIQNLYHSSPSIQPPPPPQSSYIQLDPQTAQLLAQLSSTTQSLQTTCTTLTESLRIHHEESKQLQNRIKELEKKLDEQSAAANHTGGGGAVMDKKDKATLATEVLGNSNVGEHVKQAAADYLKRLFAAEF